MRSFNCKICKQDYPEALHHEHHIIPRALGGTNDPNNLADLCQADHDLLHAVAYMLVNPKRRHEIEPTLNSMYPNDRETQRKVLEYANYAAREMALKKEIKKEPDQETRVTVELPQLYIQLLRLSGYDIPHKNGKPVGVGSLLRIIVAQFLSNKFPIRREEILALRKRK